jgi:hypothetical protein
VTDVEEWKKRNEGKRKENKTRKKKGDAEIRKQIKTIRKG